MLTVLQKKLRMQEYELYEYAVIRLVPKVERGEFFNVGLVMLCKQKGWVQMDYYLDNGILSAFCSDIEEEFIIENLEGFKNIIDGKCTAAPIAIFELAERFRWMTAVRSSSIQTSRPRVGKTEDLEKTFSELFEELVL